jgi:ribonuclease HI
MNIYTDGSFQKIKTKIYCGYGVYFGNNEYKNISKPFKLDNPTNNRAELYAIYKALKICKKHFSDIESITIYSDSEYCVKIFNIWIYKWLKDDKKYLNSDIIDKIMKILNNCKFKVKFIHIRSHTNLKDIHSVNNDKADILAKNGALKA